MPRPDPDRILVARLEGVALHHARYEPLPSAQESEAVAQIAELAGGRADLLAECAGVLIGFYDGDDLAGGRARNAARYLVLAGADETLVDGWVLIGRERRAKAGQAPFSQPKRRLERSGRKRGARPTHRPESCRTHFTGLVPGA
jgi:hypothetical protein